MLVHFLVFEIRYWLRSWMLWIFLAIISALILGATTSDHIRVGNALENTMRNAPFVIENYYSILCLLTLLMTVTFVNSAASRDFAANTHQMVFATPLRKLDYLGGRYLGSALISVLPMLGVSVGVLLGKFAPWGDAERWGPVAWKAHLDGILWFALPNTLLVAAIIFAIAVLTRSTITSYLGGLFLLTAYGVGQALTSDLKHETLGAILDPFAIRTFALVTKYWTVAEKNSITLGAHLLLLWNRLLWLGVAGLIFGFAFVRFRFEERGSKKRATLAEPETPSFSTAAPLPAVTAAFGAGAQWTQFLGVLRAELRGMVKSTSFLVITLAALLNCVPNLIFSDTEGFGNTFLPVTYRLTEIIQGTLYMFLLSLLTYYAGVLVWKERDAHTDEIEDAAPHAIWISYASKLLALLAALFLILCLTGTAGVLAQFFKGYHRYQFGLWATQLGLIDFSYFVFFAVLAFFLHVLSPNKYVGYFLFLAFAIVNQFLWGPLHVATHLVQFGDQPSASYSDFFGFAPYWKTWGWFTFYWTTFCGMLAAASIALWQRGRETGWRARLPESVLRFTGPLRALGVASFALFLGSGAWIFYNTKVLNTVRAEEDNDTLAADYEKTYKKNEGLPQPRVTAADYKIDIFPERRAAVMQADETIENKSAGPIPVLHLTLPDPNFDVTIQMDSAKLESRDERLGYRVYRFDPPLAPGEIRHLRFTTRRELRGFENNAEVLQVVQNGTFFNNSDASPAIGYQPQKELTDRNKRRKHGLKEKDLMPALEDHCTAHCMDTYLSNHADWVNVHTVISTSPDQIAIAPGSLRREWQQDGRRYFEYALDHFSLDFYAFLSANYQVQREHWNGLKLEVYFLKDQPWNVLRMMLSLRKSFEYYTKNFGPYPHQQARIIEFPRVARFAQAFPGTMPYSESIGFITDLHDPEAIDMVFYVVAHEMAHQWWAHQVVGANMQGATLLSETLAQYSALMVMEKEYGRDQMRKFLKYEMDNYLRSRGREALKERPLERVDANQGYVHYRKGSVVMYYLKEMIGEDAVNRALRKVLAKYAYAQPPYPTSRVLIDALREETPAEYQYLFKDLFSDITLFSNRALSAEAKARPDGKYDVTLEVEARKFKADDQGNETEVLADDWIEVGAFAKPEKGKTYGRTLYRQRMKMKSGTARYAFTVDQAPAQAGIDPFLLLIDRVPDDNTKDVTLR